MKPEKRCAECGVPMKVSRDHAWNSDGTITQRRDPDHRMIFFGSDGLDALFKNVEGLIGIPIEKMVIESKARATESYLSRLIRGPKGALARLVGLGRIVSFVVEQGRLMGYGDIEVTEFHWKENYMYCEIGNPYSLPLFCGDLKGANQAIRKVEGTISYEEISSDRYLIKTYSEPYAPELKGRLYPRPKPRKPGNLQLRRCGTCGIPRDLARYTWDLSAGTIKHEATGQRMAVFGPFGIQVIFDELEQELGESIPATIVEAQRMYAEASMGMRWETAREEDFRRWLAIQGMGNLIYIRDREDGFDVKIENPALPLIIVGTVAGLYEFTNKKKSDASWELKEDGDLEVSVRGA